MLIAGLAIIGFTTVGMAEEEHPKAEESKAEATKSEITAEGQAVVKEESKEEIEYGAKPELKEGEEEAKAEEKE